MSENNSEKINISKKRLVNWPKELRDIMATLEMLDNETIETNYTIEKLKLEAKKRNDEKVLKTLEKKNFRDALINQEPNVRYIFNDKIIDGKTLSEIMDQRLLDHSAILSQLKKSTENFQSMVSTDNYKLVSTTIQALDEIHMNIDTRNNELRFGEKSGFIWLKKLILANCAKLINLFDQKEQDINKDLWSEILKLPVEIQSEICINLFNPTIFVNLANDALKQKIFDILIADREVNISTNLLAKLIKNLNIQEKELVFKELFNSATESEKTFLRYLLDNRNNQVKLK